jgi:hypothetical protein
LTHSASAIASFPAAKETKKHAFRNLGRHKERAPPPPPLSLYGEKRNSRIKYEPIKVKVFLEF